MVLERLHAGKNHPATTVSKSVLLLYVEMPIDGGVQNLRERALSTSLRSSS